MNTTIRKNITAALNFARALLIPALLAVDATGLAAAENPGILPVSSRPHGKTYGEWGGAFWQWVLSIPADRNPLTDETGEFCGEGQSGPVWFLAGTFGNSAERSCTIPAGKTIFMPVFNWIFGSGVFDCDPTVPRSAVRCRVPASRGGQKYGGR